MEVTSRKWSRRARRQRVAAWIALVAVIGFVAYVWMRNFANVGPLSWWGYPQTNPRPQHVVQLQVSVPPRLNVHLYADFSTWQKDCDYYTNFPLDKRSFSHAEVIRLQGTGDEKTAMVTLDRYLPGRCNWYFSGIRYSPFEGRKVSYEDRLSFDRRVALPLEHLSRSEQRGKLREGRVDLWCTQRLSNLPATPWCTNWAMATGGRLPPPRDPVRNSPDSDKEDDAITFILPSTKVIKIYFHDLDAAAVTSKIPNGTGNH
jgi:hypothetical protein